ncbi:FAD transporter [Schizosaccharomyces pombe]|uniref:Uncharacterized mitochondrial carrier C27B12.09c n=1 Tax=Schizosaccharomyces pombe (strain 972 / ATCC 24843) TaxID=284812 RepID=YBC9_SCHPO|nr:putative FAD transporter [Schizosaccharomyces pombe]O13660.1 RecName: Full=Uncharacterized mitochondrial carrier C27B12.09c [Schizosaccharomyces pombe 972h-]BAA21451.1 MITOCHONDRIAL FAD CARRIER PROTEIN FLX1 [Schizosaccharomyces pombe]CAA16904.1 mitochondrial FAD transporter (predicted) [Schizosaccharomyces pombe]|eukprot:NP_595541.1 putative FAD transporter [Schizosaccharomyces pombe]
MDQAIAGLAAGTASTLIMHPLDLAKIQMQASMNQDSKSLFQVFKSNIGSNGSIRSLYHGLSINVLGSAASWGAYFCIYDFSKRVVMSMTPFNNGEISVLQTLCSSGFAGCIVAALTNPIWVVKSRILSKRVNYTNPFFGFYDLIKNEGLRGCYAGFAPSLLGVSQGALQFMAYEKLKLWKQRRPTSLDYIFMSAASKVFAAVNMYPLLVIRTRLQVMRSPHRSIMNLVLQTWRLQGILGFYKGFLPHLLRVVPQTCITFLVYEQVGMHFKTQSSKSQ